LRANQTPKKPILNSVLALTGVQCDVRTFCSREETLVRELRLELAQMRGDGTDSSWRDFLPLSAVFAVGLVLAASAFVASRGYYRTLDQQQFRRNATYYGTSFKDDVARHVTSLAAIRAFVSASRGVTRWEFSAYAHQILPQNTGFRAVLWVPSISRAGRQSYEASLQQDGLYGLRIRELTDQDQIVPAGDRASYLPISYVEPFDGNDNLVGLDLSRIPRFADLFRSAQQTGRIAASAPVSHPLVADTYGPVVLLVFPLSPVAAVPDAAAAGVPPQGYALGVLQLQALIKEAIGPSTAPVQAAIAYQENSHTAPSVFSGDAAHPMAADSWFKGTAFHQAMPFDIAGRHFLLALRSMDHADPVTSLYVPAGASLLVLALTALLAQNMSTTILRKRLVERAVVSRTAQLRAANETLRDEVEQRRQAEAELRIARDRAESASRAKSAFMATMSHELRTPLNAIIGFSSILAQTRANPEPRLGEYASEILRSGWRLLDLINDILDLTQMDGAAAMDGDALIYLPDCIAAVVTDAQPAARVAGVKLKSTVPNNLPGLFGDGKRVTKALAHLVSNAIKFTPEGGAAVIGAHLDEDGRLIVEVIDTGVGMPPEAKEKIWEAFSQYDGRLGRRYEGVGLGLTYVGKVAELHEAALDIVSETGKGTRIRLIFDPHRIAKELEVA
jgi:signal transduction histidine kinase